MKIWTRDDRLERSVSLPIVGAAYGEVRFPRLGSWQLPRSPSSGHEPLAIGLFHAPANACESEDGTAPMTTPGRHMNRRLLKASARGGPPPLINRRPQETQKPMPVSLPLRGRRDDPETSPRGYSSAGRAPGSHPGGRRFESA